MQVNSCKRVRKTCFIFVLGTFFAMAGPLRRSPARKRQTVQCLAREPLIDYFMAAPEPDGLQNKTRWQQHTLRAIEPRRQSTQLAAQRCRALFISGSLVCGQHIARGRDDF